jgi:hypothetical protein
MSKSPINIDWNRVATQIFLFLITSIAGVATWQMRALSTSVSELNIKMATVVQYVGESKERISEHRKKIHELDVRVTVLEENE